MPQFNKKIVLGCAQFSERYGFDASMQGISREEKYKIIRAASVNDISTLDTAHAYGSSETVLGLIGVKSFKVNTKLPVQFTTEISPKMFVHNWLSETLRKLKINKLGDVFFHRYDQISSLFGGKVYYELIALKEVGLISGIGVSVYSPHELNLVLDECHLDVVQAPYNIFDRRFENQEIINRLKSSGTRVQARSIFLQGILLQSFSRLPAYFEEWKTLFENFDLESKKYKISKEALCLSFVANKEFVDEIVVGFQSADQLNKFFGIEISKIYDNQALSIDDERLINPSKWRI